MKIDCLPICDNATLACCFGGVLVVSTASLIAGTIFALMGQNPALYGALLGGGTLISPLICLLRAKNKKSKNSPHRTKTCTTPFVSLQGVYLPL